MVEWIEVLRIPACVAGVVAMGVGWSLRSRRIHNEHWLWKKQRLRRARLLLRGGGALCVLSSAALLVL